MHRYYLDEFPSVGDIVMARVIRIDEQMGMYIRMLEYADREGFVPFSELTKNTYKNRRKLFDQQRDIPLLVIHTDIKKCHVDLSEKRVDSAEIAKHLDNFVYSSKIYELGINIHKIYEKLINIQIDVEKVLEHTIWNLEMTENSRERWINILTNPEILFTDDKLGPEIGEYMCKLIKSRTKLDPCQIHADFRLTAYSSINILNKILTENITTSDTNKILVVSPPIYRILVEDVNIERCLEKLSNISKQISDNSDLYGGKFTNYTKHTVVKDSYIRLEPLNVNEIKQF